MSSSLLRRRLYTCLGVVALSASAGVVGRIVEQRFAQRAEQKRAQERLFACEKGVVQIELGSPANANDQIVLARRATPAGPYDANAPWRLEAPLTTAADAATAAALVEAACALKRQARIEAKAGEPPLSLGAFGLSPPRHTLSLLSADGRRQTLEVGEPSAFDQALYVRQAASEANAPLVIDTVDGGFSFQVERDVTSLRDKQLFDLHGEKVVSVEVVAHGRAAFSVQPRADGGHHIVQASDPNHPLQADAAAVGGWLDSLVHLRAKQFMDEAPAPARLPHFALAPPSFEVVLQGAQGQSLARVRLGQMKVGDEPHLFGQLDVSSAPVVELEATSLADKLDDAGASLRDMRLLHCQAQDVARIDVEQAGRTLSMRRKPEPEHNDWALDGNAAAPLDGSRVSSMLYKLTHLRADTLAIDGAHADELAAAGLDAPALAVRLWDRKGETLGTLRVGGLSAERRAAVGDGERIGQIFGAALDGLSSDSNDFIAR